MRQMFSEKEIEKIVKEAGGSLPEIESGDAGKALVVNEQEDGVEWAEVGAPADDIYKLVISSSGSSASITTTVELSADIVNKLKNKTIKYILLTFGNTTADYSDKYALLRVRPIATPGKDAYAEGTSIICGKTLSSNKQIDGISGAAYYYTFKATIDTGSNILNISGTQVFSLDTYTVPKINMWGPGNVLKTSGTISNTNFNYLADGARTCMITSNDTADGEAGSYVRFCYFHKCYVDSANHFIYFRNIPCTGIPELYELKVNTTDRTYTLTQISQ